MTEFPLLIVITLVVIATLWWLIGRFVTNGFAKWLLRGVVVVGTIVIVFVVLPGMMPENTTEANVTVSATIEPIDEYVVQESSFEITLNATGNLEPSQQRNLNFEGSAPVVEITVSTGDFVEEGDVLAMLDTTDLELNLSSAELALRERQNAYNELLAPPTELELEIAQTQIDIAQASLWAAYDTAPTEYDVEIARIQAEQARNSLWQAQVNRDIQQDTPPEFRGEDPYAQDVATAGSLEASSLAVEEADRNYESVQSEGANAGSVGAANASLIQAQNDFVDLTDGADEADLRRAEIDLTDAELEVERIESDLAQMQIVAPFDGVVAAENLSLGELPPSGEAAIILLDTSTYIVELSIDETDIPDIQLGQTVRFYVDALPNEDITGIVTKIEDTPVQDGQLVSYIVEVTLEATEARLRGGMNTTATIVLSEIENAIVVPNNFIRYDSDTGQPTVTILDEDGSYQTLEVTLGARNTGQSLISAGLEPGMQLVELPEAAFNDPLAEDNNGGPGLGPGR